MFMMFLSGSRNWLQMDAVFQDSVSYLKSMWPLKIMTLMNVDSDRL